MFGEKNDRNVFGHEFCPNLIRKTSFFNSEGISSSFGFHIHGFRVQSTRAVLVLQYTTIAMLLYLKQFIVFLYTESLYTPQTGEQ